MPSRSRYLRRKYSSKNYKLKKSLRGMERLIINIAAVFALILIIFGIHSIFFDSGNKLNISLDSVQAFRIPYRNLRELKVLSEKYGIEFAQLVTIYSIENNFFPAKMEILGSSELEQIFLINYDKIKKQYSGKSIEPYYTLLRNILNEIKYFPLPYNYDNDEIPSYMFGDSWNSPSLAGSKLPIGTDIIDRENIRGRIPVVSMTSGVIEDIGWNEQGGFRVGVTTDSGTYYYYAHLDNFADNLSKGASIQPGQLLGYMGDSGNSKKEGTKGNFAVHLRVAIKPQTKLTNKEFWINPYPFLRLIEDNKVENK